MIDANMKPILIEINTNPCLELSCAILGKLIPQMLENVLRIAVDPLFPPPSYQSIKKFFNNQSSYLEKNQFELVFSE